ncbi:MAG: hypothetical protein Q8P27_01270 [Candidatus Peregrinibacteria bacterium]|nr:hypothetical protein [Candidatus Peregrinibacteria bacterium]
MSLATDFIRDLEALQRTVPRLGMINVNSENSDYCTHSDRNKDCYLLFAANFNRDCLYGGIVLTSEDCVDCECIDHCRFCYMCVDCENCYDCRYGQNLRGCSECFFCYEGVGSTNCFGSTNLRQAQYVWFNEQLTRDEYEKRLAAFDFSNRQHIEDALARLEEEKIRVPHVYSHQFKTENCIGDYMTNSKGCFACFNVHGSEDNFYMIDCWNTRDSADGMFSDGSELCYECFSYGLETYNCNFSNYIRTSTDLEYCELVFNCKSCFGCIGLQRKEYHILNVPYSPEEYAGKIKEIKDSLKEEGLYGNYHLPSTYRLEDTAAVL